MTSTTTKLQEVAEEYSQGRCDGEDEYFRNAFQERLLDRVFAAFLSTNNYRGTRCSIEDLLALNQQCPRYYHFFLDGIKYLATVRFRDEPERGMVVLQLCNADFEYSTRAGAQISRHNSTGWVNINSSKTLDYFPTLKSEMKKHFDRTRIYYNLSKQRLDAQFYNASFPEGKGMAVNWEHGYPDEEAESHWDPFP